MGWYEYLEEIEQWSQAGCQMAAAVLIGANHSSPRPPGAALIITDRGERCGAISMGCVEQEIEEQLREVLASGVSRVVRYGAVDEMMLEVGLSCGGTIEVLLTPFSCDPGLFVCIRQFQRERREAFVVMPIKGTPLRPGLWAAGRWSIPLNGPDDEALSMRMAELNPRGGTHREKMDSTQEYFIEPMQIRDRLIIVGSSPIAKTLCSFAARCGWAVWVIDPRSTYAPEEHYPAAEAVLHRWPGSALELLEVSEQDYVAVLAHDAKLDVPALAAALKAQCCYIGLLGSSKTQQVRREALQEQGFAAQDVDRVRGPIGLDIAAVSLEEIAVSVLAEMIAERHR